MSLVQQQQLTSQEQELNETTANTWLAIGSFAETLGDVDRAAVAYDCTLRHDPNNFKALTSLANLYRSRDLFAKAAELYQRALSTKQDAGETWGLLGHCYLMLDDLQRAYAAYQQALYHLNNPNVPKLWHGIGILYDRYGSLEYAEEAFRRVLELDPNFEKASEIYFRLGIIYKHESKLAQALECFRYILPNPPAPLTQPDVWFQIGSVLEQQRDYENAKDAYQKVLQANPKHAKVLQQLGCLYSQQGSSFQDPEISLRLLSQSLEIDSSDAHTWYHLGRVHMSRGDYTSAYDAFQQAVNRDARNPTFWCSIGVLYYQISQYRDALDAYTRAIRLNPYISEVWYDLGTLYETCNNQISDALDAYKQAATLDPNNPHIQARLEQLTLYQKNGGQGAPPPPPPGPQGPQGGQLRVPHNVLQSHQPQQQQQQPVQQLQLNSAFPPQPPSQQIFQDQKSTLPVPVQQSEQQPTIQHELQPIASKQVNPQKRELEESKQEAIKKPKTNGNISAGSDPQPNEPNGNLQSEVKVNHEQPKAVEPNSSNPEEKSATQTPQPQPQLPPVIGKPEETQSQSVQPEPSLEQEAQPKTEIAEPEAKSESQTQPQSQPQPKPEPELQPQTQPQTQPEPEPTIKPSEETLSELKEEEKEKETEKDIEAKESTEKPTVSEVKVRNIVEDDEYDEDDDDDVKK